MIGLQLSSLQNGFFVDELSILLLTDLSTLQFVCDRILYRVISLQLNSLHGGFFVAELSTR